jgi:hypothetical protein
MLSQRHSHAGGNPESRPGIGFRQWHAGMTRKQQKGYSRTSPLLHFTVRWFNTTCIGLPRELLSYSSLSASIQVPFILIYGT